MPEDIPYSCSHSPHVAPAAAPKYSLKIFPQKIPPKCSPKRVPQNIPSLYRAWNKANVQSIGGGFLVQGVEQSKCPVYWRGISCGGQRPHHGPVNRSNLTPRPFYQNGLQAKSGFEMCFGPSALDAGAKTRLESRIKKFTPHCVCRPCRAPVLRWRALRRQPDHGYVEALFAVWRGMVASN